jgi:methyl-accepting chemotaxis protein
VTQQNAALVEENAATARVLSDMAKAMREHVAFFKLGDDSEETEQAVVEDHEQQRSLPPRVHRAGTGRRAAA